MNTQDKAVPSNFIRNIIDGDIAAGKHGGRVATRFPPEPNGYLHVGHAKSICLNFGIARDYKGTCNLRFDDTNPHKENIEYVEAIKQDVRWLGYDWDERLYYASDYFEQLHDYALQLIRKGKAYVCDLTPEQTREYRGTLTAPGKDSPFRSRSVEEKASRMGLVAPLGGAAEGEWSRSEERTMIAKRRLAGILVVAAMVAVFFAGHILWPEASAEAPLSGRFEWVALLIALAALFALWRLKWGIIPVIAASAAIGLGYSLPI